MEEHHLHGESCAKPKEHSLHYPSPAFDRPFDADHRLISSITNNTLTLHMLSYSFITSLVARNFSGLSPRLSSTLSTIPLPPGCTTQNREFHSS